MRVDMPNKGGNTDGSFNIAGSNLTGPLLLAGDPSSPMEASTKRYVDTAVNSLNAGNITSGIISINRLPSFIGDFTNQVGSNIFTLNKSGVVPGTYTKVTTNAKGIITGGGYVTLADIPQFSWNKITSGKPNSIAGFNLSDAVNKAGDTMTGALSAHAAPTQNTHAATKQYVDSLIVSSVTLKVGDTLRRTSNASYAGYLQCNGGEISKTTYAALYGVLGDKYTYPTNIRVGNGCPWQQQYEFNSTQSADITGWATGTALPGTMYNSRVVVTKNRVYLLGGFLNSSTPSKNVYTAPINADGSIGAWVKDVDLPYTMSEFTVIVTKNLVYILGGGVDGHMSNAIYSATVNSDGTLNAFTETPNRLPDFYTEAKSLVTRNRVYLLPGLVRNGAANTVFSCPINADGTLGAWVYVDSFPSFIALSQIAVTKDRVYVLGSYNSSNVYTAPVNADGTIGSWSLTTPLPQIVCNAQVVVTKNKVYLIGGQTSTNVYLSTVYTAVINADGTLGTWTSGTSIPGVLANSQLITTNSKIYLLGGDTASNTHVSTVYSANFVGGLNDYSVYYDGSGVTVDPANFKLPDTSSIDPTDIYTFIKY